MRNICIPSLKLIYFVVFLVMLWTKDWPIKLPLAKTCLVKCAILNTFFLEINVTIVSCILKTFFFKHYVELTFEDGNNNNKHFIL